MSGSLLGVRRVWCDTCMSSAGLDFRAVHRERDRKSKERDKERERQRQRETDRKREREEEGEGREGEERTGEEERGERQKEREAERADRQTEGFCPSAVVCSHARLVTTRGFKRLVLLFID